MKAYIQTDKLGNFYNVSAYVANDGFQTLDRETQKYVSADEITDPDPEIVVVGGIGNVRKRLSQLGIERPSVEINYPQELQKYLGRKVWASTLEEVFRNEENWNIFVKPRLETKKFTGKVVREYRDYAYF